MVQKMWIRVTKVARAYNVARMFVICFKKIGVTIPYYFYYWSMRDIMVKVLAKLFTLSRLQLLWFKKNNR